MSSEKRRERAFKSLPTELASARGLSGHLRLEMESDPRAEEFVLPAQRQLPGRWESEWLNLTGLGSLPASRSWGEEDRKTKAWTSMGHSATESPKESENSWLSKEGDKERDVKGEKKRLG